jgi:hypothetical protein
MMRSTIFLSLLRSAIALVVRQHELNSSGIAMTNSTVATHRQSFDGALVYDLGFFDGMDSWHYLQQGMHVVAVEADPSLVQDANVNANFVPFISSGKLVILNLAIAPDGQAESVQTPFYLNKCNKEWNSFYPSVGCRSCAPPHTEDRSMCTVLQVMSTPCLQVLQTHAIPVYMKGDMEGGESGCFKALWNFPVDQRPQYISGELTGPQMIDMFGGLGYTSFKIVLQTDSTSGAWGDPAVDCRHGTQWRSQASGNTELKRMFDDKVIQSDPCPSMVGGLGKSVWYDIHASKTPPQVWN